MDSSLSHLSMTLYKVYLTAHPRILTTKRELQSTSGSYNTHPSTTPFRFSSSSISFCFFLSIFQSMVDDINIRLCLGFYHVFGYFFFFSQSKTHNRAIIFPLRHWLTRSSGGKRLVLLGGLLIVILQTNFADLLILVDVCLVVSWLEFSVIWMWGFWLRKRGCGCVCQGCCECDLD